MMQPVEAKKPKTKKTKLSVEEKVQIEKLFEPLLSETFGGNKYKSYSIEMVKKLATDSIKERLSARPYSVAVVAIVSRTLTKIQKAPTTLKVLEHISEMCLLEEELSEN